MDRELGSCQSQQCAVICRWPRFDVGGVDGSGAVIEDLVPDALPAQSVEAIVDRRVGAVFGWAVPSSRAAAKHMNNA